MKIISALVCLFSVSAFASSSGLNQWTSNAGSVSAVLFESIQSASANPSHAGRITRANRVLTVADNKSAVFCEAGTLGMAMVMSYRCGVRGDITTWTMNADSTQAVIYGFLREAYVADKASRYPQNLIQMNGPTLTINDGTTTLSCTETTLGMAMAMSYSCTVK